MGGQKKERKKSLIDYFFCLSEVKNEHKKHGLFYLFMLVVFSAFEKTRTHSNQMDFENHPQEQGYGARFRRLGSRWQGS